MMLIPASFAWTLFICPLLSSLSLALSPPTIAAALALLSSSSPFYPSTRINCFPASLSTFPPRCSSDSLSSCRVSSHHSPFHFHNATLNVLLPLGSRRRASSVSTAPQLSPHTIQRNWLPINTHSNNGSVCSAATVSLRNNQIPVNDCISGGWLLRSELVSSA